MTSDKLQEELGTLLGRCINVIRELETENAELKVRREWQGLTDEEIADAIRPLCGENESVLRQLIAFSIDEYRAIEAALKGKNNGVG